MTFDGREPRLCKFRLSRSWLHEIILLRSQFNLDRRRTRSSYVSFPDANPAHKAQPVLLASVSRAIYAQMKEIARPDIAKPLLVRFLFTVSTLQLPFKIVVRYSLLA